MIPHLSTGDDFIRFCSDHPDLRVERNAYGDIIVMPPTGVETGFRNSQVTAQLTEWASQDGRGQVFDSSTGYLLPDTSILSPDASWVLNSRLRQLTPPPSDSPAKNPSLDSSCS